MKPWQVLFKQSPRGSSAQGGSTGEDDFNDEAADDALAEEGEAELGEDGDGEEPESEDEEEEQSEDQDDLDEEEEELEEEEFEEEAEEPSFKYKNEKTGDFDFKRINKVLGGGELESYIKEQNATITRSSQELKSYKELGAPPQELQARSRRAMFLDKMYEENPVIRGEVDRILGLSARDGGRASGGEIKLPDGVDPRDPLAQPLIQALQEVKSISNRLMNDDRAKQKDAQEQKFATALNEGQARFKELTGKALSPEQAQLLDQEMRQSGYANASRLIPGLFFEEIRAADAAKFQKQRMVKKNLPRNGSKGKSPAPGKAKRRSREEDNDRLWNEHMGNDAD